MAQFQTAPVRQERGCPQGVRLFVPAIYYVILFLGLSFFVGLATYVFLSRDRRPIHRPLVLFLLVQAAQFGAIALVKLQGADGPDPSLVWTLRARFALAFFTLPLFIHMAACLMQGRARQRALGFMRLGYPLAAGAAALTLGPTWIMAAPLLRGPLGGNTVGAVLTPSSFTLAGLWDVLAWIGAVSVLLYARNRRDAPGARADLIRLSAAWLVLLLADMVGVAALLAQADSPTIASRLGNLQYMTCIVAVVILAAGILRYGSPAGRPMPSAMGISALLAVGALVSLDLLPLLDPSAMTHTAMLIVAPVGGLVTGALLGKIDPRLPESSWSEDLLATRRGSFTRRLGPLGSIWPWEPLPAWPLSACGRP